MVFNGSMTVSKTVGLGSNPSALAIIFGVYCQFGRRSGLGPEGRKFESCYPDHFYQFKYPLIQKRRLL